MKRCLHCYNSITKENPGESDLHYDCSVQFFNEVIPPQFPYTQEDIAKLAAKVIRSRFTVTGVQPKLSLEIARKNLKAGGAKDKKTGAQKKGSGKAAASRLTIVGVPGNYILKPPTPDYSQLPEIEHLSMKLAKLAKIETVPHTLIKMKDGAPAYLTRRIDRLGEAGAARKIHMEDMCQLTGRLTEHKYQGSYEKIARTINSFSVNPLLDVINFYEQVAFSFLIGNADMHLKNFSLIKDPRFSSQDFGYILSPAYDMVSTALVLDDPEELALTLNGKKRKITRSDFESAMSEAGVYPKSIENVFIKFGKVYEPWRELILKSFLTKKKKEQLISIIDERVERLKIKI